MTELFKLGNNRLVELNKEWISTIKEFKKLITRDKGSKGDIDGRKKFQAMREFTFIYHYCDYRSQYINYSEADRLVEALKNAELPDNLDITKDEDLANAIIKYKQLQETPALKILNEAKEGLYTAHRVIRKLRTSLETKLEAADFDELEETEGKNGKKLIIDPVTKLTNNLKALMDLTNEIGPTLREIKELEEEVKKELGDKKELRGGKQKGHKEDPTTNRALPIAPTGEEDDNESSEGNSLGRPGIFDDL